MTPRPARRLRIGLAGLCLAVALVLALLALREKAAFYFTPSEVLERQDALLAEGRPFRLGGVVVEGSLKKNGPQIRFAVTDLKAELWVRFHGIPPDLFREGQGVVAEGRLVAKEQFEAETLLAKHDENYMPPSMEGVLDTSAPEKK